MEVRNRRFPTRLTSVAASLPALASGLLSREQRNKLVLLLPASIAEKILRVGRYKKGLLARASRLPSRLPTWRSPWLHLTDNALYYVDPRKIVVAMDDEVPAGRSGEKNEHGVAREGLDEVIVNIGRHGDLVLSGGSQRLALARIAGIEQVPVRIAVRHTQWDAFRREIEYFALQHEATVYAPLTHIDLQHIPARYSDARWHMIRENLGQGNSTVLDIGAHWGYFCHKFEDEGFRCFAVEVDKEHLYFLRKLRRAESRRFTIIPRSVFDMRREGPLKYDIVLALAIFHHFLKDRTSFEQLKVLLGLLDMNEMYFEPHVYDEPQMRGAFMNLPPEKFMSFVLDNSCLNNSKLIGRCEDERPVFKLWR